MFSSIQKLKEVKSVPNEESIVFNQQQLAKYLGVRVASINYLVYQKKCFPCLKIGKEFRFPKEAIDTWVKDNTKFSGKHFKHLLK